MIVPGVLSRYISVVEAYHVEEICRPMFDLFGINYFGYFRIFSDETCMGLVSDPRWFEHFVNQGFSYQSAKKLASGQHLWVNTHSSSVYKHAREHFNHDHGLFVVEQKKDYLESAIFATHRGNDKILDFYLNYPDLLKKFILYFQYVADPLIRKASLHRMRLTYDLKMTDQHQVEMRKAFENQFLVTSSRGFVIITKEGHVYVTNQEKECLIRLYEGKLVKSIAYELDISVRTAEEHIANLRKKFNCKNITALVSKTLRQLDIYRENT